MPSNCPNCGNKLKQIKGKVKFAAQIDDMVERISTSDPKDRKK